MTYYNTYYNFNSYNIGTQRHNKQIVIHQIASNCVINCVFWLILSLLTQFQMTVSLDTSERP